jgi:mono/diheme cytochrome c family protein
MSYSQLRGVLGASLALVLGLTLSACGDDDAADAAPLLVDAGAADAPVADASPTFDANPKLLSSQGLYADIAAKTIVADALEYVPAYELWSDGAEKRRWLLLPDADAKIDTSDMDHWRFPVGTKLFKEFRDPVSGKLLETRLLRVDGEDEIFMTSFIWDEDESDALLSRGGAEDVLGTEHDVPSQTRCVTCHRAEPGRVLGFSALQLSKPEAPNLASLRARMSAPPALDADFRPPGDEATRAAFGYLHANCGVCHSELGSAAGDTCEQAPDGTRSKCLILRLAISETGDADPTTSELWISTVGETTHGNYMPGQFRVKPGTPDESALAIRPAQRGDGGQMPPAFASEKIDGPGVALIEAWIDGLAP